MKRLIILCVLLVAIPAIASAVSYTSPRHGVTGLDDIVTKGPWVDVRAYGADPAYTSTVNAVAIQAALDAAGNAGGGVVVVPIGEYTSTRLEIPSYVTLTGMGAGSILKLADGANDRFIVSEGWPSTAATDIAVTNLFINGNNRNQTDDGPGDAQGNRGCLDFKYVTGLLVENVIVEDPFHAGIETTYSTNIRILNNTIRRASDDGIGVNEESSYAVVSGNKIENNVEFETFGGSNGIEIQDGAHDVVINANVISFVGYTPVANILGIGVNSHAGEPGCYNVIIADNDITSDATGASVIMVSLSARANSTAHHITVTGNTLHHSDGTAKGMGINNITDVVVSNNSMGPLLSQSITLEANLARVLISNNTIQGGNLFIFAAGTIVDNMRINNNILWFTYKAFDTASGTATFNDVSLTGNEIISETPGSDWHFYFLAAGDTNTYTTKVEVANNRFSGALKYYPTDTDLSGFDFYNNIISDVRTTPERYYAPQPAEATTTEGTVAYADSTNWNPHSGKGTYMYSGAEWRMMWLPVCTSGDILVSGGSGAYACSTP